MTPAQENQLFHTLGSIEAQQKAMIEGLARNQQAIRESAESVNNRLDRMERDLDRRFDEVNTRIEVNEEATKQQAQELANVKVKMAGYGGAAGLVTILVAELVKGALK